MNKPLNIVLLVSDDHGVETLGCYGNKSIQTPNMDALAADGVRFTQAFCTSSSCSASRANILTGLYNHATGTYGLIHGYHHFSCLDHIKTLPTYFKEGGYRTGHVGKSHFAPESLFPFDWFRSNKHYGRDDIKMAEDCRDFINEDGPFFLYWCSMNPHRSGSPGGRNSMLPDKFGNPENDFPGDKEQIYDPAEVEIPSFLNDTPTARAELAEYYQSISRLDRGIGRLIQVLRDTGKLDSTLIVYISDNGAAFPQAKTTLYEPGMRLPCIVRSPIHKNRGTTCDGLITWTDITPTLLDFAGLLDNPEAFHGRSFKDILDEPQPENWRDHIFASHSFHEITNYYPMRVLRSDRYKFIYNIAWKLDYPFAADLWDSSTWQEVIRTDSSQFGKRKVEAYVQRPRYELYDLENDPDELVNLADKPEHAETVERFAGFIKEFQEETDDPWAIKWLHE